MDQTANHPPPSDPPTSGAQSGSQHPTLHPWELLAHCSTFTGAVVAFFGLALTFAALAFGIRQWKQAKIQWSEERVLEFQKDWLSPEMVQSFININDAIICNIGKSNPDIAFQENELSPWDSGSLFDYSFFLSVTVPRLNYRGLDRELQRHLGFFSSLNNCNESSCNLPLSCRIFWKYANNDNRMFSPLLRKQRAMFGPAYGRDFDEFLAKCGAPQKISIEPTYFTASDQVEAATGLKELAPDIRAMASGAKGRGTRRKSDLEIRSEQACRRMQPDSVKAD